MTEPDDPPPDIVIEGETYKSIHAYNGCLVGTGIDPDGDLWVALTFNDSTEFSPDVQLAIPPDLAIRMGDSIRHQLTAQRLFNQRNR